jgi:hypothetical protein
LAVVPEWPLVYWWDKGFLARYRDAPKLSEEMESRVGIRTSNNDRFVRRPWEIKYTDLLLVRWPNDLPHPTK